MAKTRLNSLVNAGSIFVLEVFEHSFRIKSEAQVLFNLNLLMLFRTSCSVISAFNSNYNNETLKGFTSSSTPVFSVEIVLRFLKCSAKAPRDTFSIIIELLLSVLLSKFQ